MNGGCLFQANTAKCSTVQKSADANAEQGKSNERPNLRPQENFICERIHDLYLQYFEGANL